MEGKLNTETPAYHHRVEGHIWSDLIAESNIGQLSLSLTLSELLFIHSLGEQHTHSLSPRRPWFPQCCNNDLGRLKVLSKKMEVKVSVILTVSGHSPVITDSLIGLRNIPVRHQLSLT